jgi:hypothetical protein
LFSDDFDDFDFDVDHFDVKIYRLAMILKFLTKFDIAQCEPELLTQHLLERRADNRLGKDGSRSVPLTQ